MSSSSSSSPEMHGADSQDRFSYKLATHEEVLDDLSSRFILNLPDDELSSLERICFQVEQAHWFYEDFIREENPKFPSLPLKKFSEMLFQACPLLHQWSHNHEHAYSTFMQYKTRVPVCGAIMLNDTWEKCVLVKGWKSSSGWGFPKGKINEVEPPANCAIREVLEETGYNLAGKLNPENVIEMSIREQKISLFIVPEVPEDYPFKTKTRKEISKIEWFRLADLPTWKRNKTGAGRFYLISPFIGPLKAFIRANKPRASRKTIKSKKSQSTPLDGLQARVSGADLSLGPNSQPSSILDVSLHIPSPRSSDPHPTTSAPEQRSSAIPTDAHLANLLSALAMSASNSSKPLSVNSPSKAYVVADLLNDAVTEITPTGASNKVLPVPASSQISPLDSATRRDPSLPQTVRSPPCTTIVADLTPPPASQPALLSPVSSQLPSSGPYSTGNISKQHIALLDAVSKESAKLQQAYKTAAANGVPINVNDNFKYPISATSAPLPSPAAGMDIRATFNYPTSPIAPQPLVTQGPPNIYPNGQLSGTQSSTAVRPLNSMYTPLQVRPRTSLACHRGPMSMPGSASMNQSQLLALMNGSSTNPSASYHGYAQPLPMSPFCAPAPGPRPPIWAPHLGPGSGTYNPMPTSYVPADSLSQTNHTLLSILNGDRSTSQLSSPYSSNFLARE